MLNGYILPQNDQIPEMIKVKGKGLPVTCHAGTEGNRGIAVLILNLGT
jgi:hypothetical protein